MTADTMWIVQSNSGVDFCVNKGDNIPKIKAGPALLQKPSILRASSLVRAWFLYACAILCAPTGYPPRNPRRSNDSLPLGILQSFPNGRRRGMLAPKLTELMIAENIKKGNKEGIIVYKHKVMPSFAPFKDVCASIIKINIMTEERIPISNRFLLFMDNTSQECMLRMENNHLVYIDYSEGVGVLA